MRPEREPTGLFDRDGLTRRLAVAAPTVGPRLAESLRPAVRFAIRREPDVAIDIGQSKIGGAPDLPEGMPWPSWTTPAGEHRTLQFFAQVELASANAAAPGPLGLPTDGELSFFADFEAGGGGITGLHDWEQAGCLVVYSPPSERLVRRSLRMEPLETGQLSPLGVWTWPDARLDDGGELDVPDGEAEALDALDQELGASLHALVPDRWQLSGRHQLGGHARFIQHPVEHEVVQALAGCWSGREGFDAGAWDQSRHQVREWRVLLQLDSDLALDLLWGDAGTLWWAARHDDVAAGRWDAGMFNFQCS